MVLEVWKQFSAFILKGQAEQTESSWDPESSQLLTGLYGLASQKIWIFKTAVFLVFNLLKPTAHMMDQQFNIQQMYVLPTLYLCVSYLSENKQRLVPLTA